MVPLILVAIYYFMVTKSIAIVSSQHNCFLEVLLSGTCQYFMITKYAMSVSHTWKKTIESRKHPLMQKSPFHQYHTNPTHSLAWNIVNTDSFILLGNKSTSIVIPVTLQKWKVSQINLQAVIHRSEPFPGLECLVSLLPSHSRAVCTKRGRREKGGPKQG